MSFITLKCPTCNKLAREVSHSFVQSVRFVKLDCGHTLIQHQTEEKEKEVISKRGYKLYPFQKDGVKFAEKSNVKCLIADEMGLGKTVQALALLEAHPELTPALILCKSALKCQWLEEIIHWTNYIPQQIDSSIEKAYSGFPIYIVSLDLLRRVNGLFKDIELKSMIIDECQLIKNPESKRAQEVRELAKAIPHIIALSGTPIKNYAGEYFSILNILRPEIFPRRSDFEWKWVDTYWDGYRYRSGGLKHPERFKELTRDFIIRREREEVMPDLPTVSRNFRYSDLGKEVEQAYINEVREFQDFYGEGMLSSIAERGNVMGYLSRMRHITALSKVDPTIDFVMEFLGSTTRKITIFIHHQDVGKLLYYKLKTLMNELKMKDPLQFTSDLDAQQRDEVVRKFREEDYRVLICSTLAGGEGLNLQFCSDCIIHERQWNPANEEQAEARFIRIGQKATSVTSTYMVAVGTIDEFFAELVERKREIFAQAMSGKDVPWDEASLIRELADILMTRGLKKWKVS